MTHVFSILTSLSSKVPSLRHPDSGTYLSLIARISSFTNHLIAGAVPAVLVSFIGGYRGSVHEIHHGFLAAIAGRFVAPHYKAFESIVLSIR